ncbi:hypothetical protein [Marinomonas atlantica]|uniref:hypothetical protein n=1 Tax=Marinomonas atlantica TaxID=1806668 RepID=UPI00082D088F|nr:hypothetical protein [Marinomonas atlantica]
MPVTAIDAPGAAKSAINPISGVFGTGQIKLIFNDENFIAPVTGKYRIRVWGAGGKYRYSAAGAGGGFSMKTIELNEGDVIPVTVARSSMGNTTSFGVHLSATSGSTLTTNSNTNTVGGVGIGGDVNYVGGRGAYVSSTGQYRMAGGAASLFGNGGEAVDSNYLIDTGGSGPSSYYQPIDPVSTTGGHEMTFQECLLYGLDFIGAGCGGTDRRNAASGGGAGNISSYFGIAGFPAGGGSDGPNQTGANGLVTVEY